MDIFVRGTKGAGAVWVLKGAPPLSVRRRDPSRRPVHAALRCFTNTYSFQRYSCIICLRGTCKTYSSSSRSRCTGNGHQSFNNRRAGPDSGSQRPETTQFSGDGAAYTYRVTIPTQQHHRPAKSKARETKPRGRIMRNPGTWVPQTQALTIASPNKPTILPLSQTVNV